MRKRTLPFHASVRLRSGAALTVAPVSQPRGRKLGPAAALYVFAQLGAYLAFVPLFALLLPRRAVLMAPDRAAAFLSLVLLVGGLTASIAHVLVGRFSDVWMRKHGNRRAVLCAGLLATLGSLALLGYLMREGAMVLGIVLFQLSFNLLFAPLGAVLADHFPDSARGRIAALTNPALQLANLGTTLLALLFPHDTPMAFAILAALIGFLVLPLCVAWPFDRVYLPALPVEDHPDEFEPLSLVRRDFVLLWFSRMVLQIGAAFVLNYFYLYLSAIGLGGSGGVSDLMGKLALVAALVAVPVTLVGGIWSDMRVRRRLPMIAAAVLCAITLIIMALTDSLTAIYIGFVGFQTGLAIYLSIDMALVARLVSRHERCGELLGYMNLTNTIPSILTPATILLFADQRSNLPWASCFMVVAVLSLIAAGLVTRVRSVA